MIPWKRKGVRNGKVNVENNSTDKLTYDSLSGTLPGIKLKSNYEGFKTTRVMSLTDLKIMSTNQKQYKVLR
ncbi:hypothetical protein [Borrelia miyamotoi]|uniref:hypothetical protein n=1 Tax=Borrelia miyamotoi TaxID=47466 RepID=UPI00087C3A54|nr:hypothetical protein [Borrelia miyamotoi]AOW96233.1 hypothetical protein AXH25_04975 [Borrelia miyamotoi]WAZ96976.1 hypothetical protein O5405_06780 [Borrelia miyamotoi]WAZ98289.1 hypothetical protein O5401_06725 [Borrelia miyamotoi]